MTDDDLLTASDEDFRRRITARLQEVYGRDPRYRYFKANDQTMFVWTTERMGDGKYASTVYVPKGKGSRSGDPQRWESRREVHHTTRKAAKARALRLYREHQARLQG
jgi:hypothetical protein